MKISAAWLIRIAALALAAGAPAQPPPADDGQDRGIVVTGSRDRDRALRDYVDAVTVETSEQIARFAVPVCPASFGLPGAHNEVVALRVREIARRAGLRTGARGCRPNVVIIVADSGRDFVAALRSRRPALFQSLGLPEIRALDRAEGPIRAWQMVEPRGADGRPMQPVSFIEVGGRLQYIGTARLLTGVMPSLTRQPTRQDLTLSFIVFDLDAIAGLTLAQIADHAAMRALARTESGALPAGRSILALFADRRAGAVPADALTPWDAAYLEALYRTDDAATASRQRSNLLRRMRRELEGGSETRRP